MSRGVRAVLPVCVWTMFLLACPAWAQTVIRVNAATGVDTNDGLSWEAAKKTVTAGLAAVISGDQLWVAAGTYVERITLKVGVALYGGFAGNENALSERNWTANVTILDGNQGVGGSVVTVPEGARRRPESTALRSRTIRTSQVAVSTATGRLRRL